MKRPNSLLKSPKIVLLVGAIVVILCLCAVFGGIGNLFGGGIGNLLGGGGQQGQLGQLYTAVEIDRNGCPVDEESQFYRDDTVYVGVEESQIPSGTAMFMRLYYEGRELEDTPEIKADSNLKTCVWFEFSPSTSVNGLQPGSYQAELIVNGNPVDTIAFQVTDTRSGSSGGVPNTGAAQLGRIYAASAVDNNGCPVDNVSQFYTNESVYVSVDESFIPAGTEMFARLVREGQPVEDTEAIRADTDMRTCVWFVFESSSSVGLQPGNYEAEVYVNGRLADRVQFSVRQ